MESMTQTPTMEEVQKFLESDKPERATKAVFLFLYKEILANRLLILEAKPHDNSAAIVHCEKMINELNEKLMKHMK